MLNLMPNTATPGTPNSAPPFVPRRGVNPPDWQRPVANAISSVKRHWLVALSVILLFLAFGAFVLWKKAKPVYESHSIVYISPKFPKILASDSEVELPYDSYV